MRPRVFVSRAKTEQDVERRFIEALEWLDWGSVVRPSSRVFIKPNLTWPTPLRGCTTSLTFLSLIVGLLSSRTTHIFIGESDGGYHSFAADDAFAGHNLKELTRRFGAKLVNLSRVERKSVTQHIGTVGVELELPRLLLDDIDVFVTAPVPKIHAMTRVSLGLKNQWGCLPDAMRLRWHAEFDTRILAVNKTVRPLLALYDGEYFLDRNGPIHGEAVRMGAVVAANDVGAGDVACCEIMGMNAKGVSHLRRAMVEGMCVAGLGEVAVKGDIRELVTRRFRLDRSLVNWMALCAFKSRALTRIGYESPLGAAIHYCLDSLAKREGMARLLYGDIVLAGKKSEKGRGRVR